MQHELRFEPLIVDDRQHHDLQYERKYDHDSNIRGHHPELDHHYDDQHDIEPVHFHEHAILHSPNLPDHHSYHHSEREADMHHRFPTIVHHDDHEPVVYHHD